MFCAPSRIDDPASASDTSGIRMSAGAIRMSRSCASVAASGSSSARIPATSARASTGTRFIFQFAAISFLRTWLLCRSDFERLDARQLAAFEKFEGGAAAGRDMRELARPRRVRDGRRCIAAADYRNHADLVGQRLADAIGAAGESGNLEKSERPVPDYGFGALDFRYKCRSGLRPDVEAHHFGRDFRYRMRRRIGLRSGCNDMIRWQNNFDAFARG